MSNEQKQPQEGKSPGEMINEYMKSHKDELYLNDCKKLMEQYAAQQTAALREELHQAQQEIMRLKNLHLGPLITQGDKAIKAIQKQNKLANELEHLKNWKRQQLATFAPLLDYGQSKEAGLSLGSSIVQEAIKALKERKGMQEELETMKKEKAEFDSKMLVSQWISVDEMLPREGEVVIIAEWWGDHWLICSSEYKEMEFHDGQDEQPGTWAPSFWQPLPAPPEFQNK